MLNRDDLLGRRQRRYLVVALPGGGEVRIQSLTEGERTRHELKTSDAKGNWSKAKAVDARVHMLAISLVDDQGNLLFDESRDLDTLRELDSADAATIYGACLDLNSSVRIDVEDVKKNSSSDDFESPYDSPVSLESLTLAAGSTS